jgi:hypothetical protein
MSRNSSYVVAALAMAVAAGDARAEQKIGAEGLIMVEAHMRECLEADNLLRNTCPRIVEHLSDANKKHCSLPVTTFEERTAYAYRAFHDAHADEIAANADRIAKVTRIAQESFDHQFAEVRAGRVSMFDLETLQRILNDTCATTEQWLAR